MYFLPVLLLKSVLPSTTLAPYKDPVLVYPASRTFFYVSKNKKSPEHTNLIPLLLRTEDKEQQTEVRYTGTRDQTHSG